SNTLPTIVTLAADETSATLTVATMGDSTDEADGRLTLQFDSTKIPASYTVTSLSVATVTIKDDDGPEISVVDVSADEPDGQLVFTVALDLTPVEQTEVMWETANDTTGISPATAGADYTAASGKLTFAAGTATLSLSATINIADDGDVEPDETFLLTLSNPTNEATFAAGASAVTATGTITSDDVTFVSVDNADANENENLEFTVTLAPVSYLTVVVNYATMDGTAKAGSDYDISNGMLTFMPYVSSGTITVFITDDDITEGEEDLTLTLSDAIHATIFSGSTSVTGTITDNEMPGLSIRASDSSVTEGTPAVFIITSTNSPMHDTDIGVTASETDGFVDSSALPTFVTLAADETSATLTVATMGDSTDEADGSLTLQFDSTKIPASYTVTSLSVATVNIKDDDGPEISVADVTADETDDQLVFTVTLDLMPIEQTEVSWTTSDNTSAPVAGQAMAGTAPPTTGTDYITSSGTLTFAAKGNTSMNVTVSIVNDDLVEPDETFLLTLSAPSNEATLAAGSSVATGTITSEDVPAVHIDADQDAVTEGNPATFTITANQGPLADLTVAISTEVEPVSFRDGTPPATVTIAASATTATYTVNTKTADGTGTGTITATVDDRSSITYTATAPTSDMVTVLDSTTRTISVSGPTTVAEADDATVEFTVMLSSRPDATAHTVTVDYATVDGTAGMGSDYTAARGTLTFAGSETSKTVTVTIINDTAYENPDEQFQMGLSDPQPSGNKTGTELAEVEIVDDDRITLSIAPVTDKTIVTEAADATLAYQVSFTGATQVQNDLTIHYAVDSASTAIAGGNADEGKNDYTAPSGSLTFAAGDGTNQTVLVTVLDDDIVENDETVILTLGTPTQPRLSLVAGSTTATGTIRDDEMPTLSIRAAASTVTEGTPAVFTITSNKRPMDDTAISVVGTETDAFVANALPTTVTLVANETTATLTIATDNDMTDEADGSLTVRLDIGSGLTNYTVDSAAATVTVTIKDDDGPKVSVAAASTDETDERLVFTVSLSATPIEQTEVSWATGTDMTQGAIPATASVDPNALGADYVAGNGTLTFAAGAADLGLSVTVSVVDDPEVEPDETFLLTLSAPSNDATLDADASAAIGTITSDDVTFVSVAD
ncbi:MAG: Calx-beta domain-containing protein, partial [Pseudohongiellaceae bacterium]